MKQIIMNSKNAENNKLLTESGSEICDILELDYIHGKFDYSVSPDFCGFSSKAIGKKNSDKVVFRINEKININNLYKIIYKSGHVLDIKIEKTEDGIFFANIISNE